jgi:hypothetical protein
MKERVLWSSDGRSGEWSPVSLHCYLLGRLLPYWNSGRKWLRPRPSKNPIKGCPISRKPRRGSSETIRSATPGDESDADFNDWLAGLIDADGGFYLSKQGYASCEITMHSKEVQKLAFIKHKLGGKLTPRLGSNSVRWRLHNAQGMNELLHRINGRIRTTTKLGQLSRVLASKG